MNGRGVVRFTAWASAGAMLVGGMGTAAAETIGSQAASNLGGRQEGLEICQERISTEMGVILTAI